MTNPPPLGYTVGTEQEMEYTPMNKRDLLDRCARDGTQRMLLARMLDRLELCQQREIPTQTPFLSPGEQAAGANLLAACGHPRHLFFGGFEGAERKICLFLPQWQESEDAIGQEDGPLAVLSATFRPESELTHRDLLGSLMGLGITREKIGDILISPGVAQVLVLRETLTILLSQWESAGRWKLSLRETPLSGLHPAVPQTKVIRDTVATPRLDAVVSSGFSLSRAKAAALISAGRVSLNHRQCLKADRTVIQGDIISCRGLGKCMVKECSGQSRKGRTMLLLERYI